MDLGLDGKRVYITASTNGIGKETAVTFLREGATVIINGRDENRLMTTLNELRKGYGEEKVYAVCGDMSDEETIKCAVGKIKEYVSDIDIVVGNLGTGKPVSDDKFDLREWEYMLKMNLLSAVGLIQNTRDLFSGNGGSIVLTASLAAHDRIGAPPAYAAAKAGIISLVKYAAPILSEYKIRINAVSPGNIFFEGGRWEELSSQDSVGVNEYIEKEVPMKRFGTTGEIAEMIAYLSSVKSSFTTGAVIQIDGGQGKGY